MWCQLTESADAHPCAPEVAADYTSPRQGSAQLILPLATMLAFSRITRKPDAGKC